MTSAVSPPLTTPPAQTTILEARTSPSILPSICKVSGVVIVPVISVRAVMIEVVHGLGALSVSFAGSITGSGAGAPRPKRAAARNSVAEPAAARRAFVAASRKSVSDMGQFLAAPNAGVAPCKDGAGPGRLNG